ncbi:MAG TPA: metallophosphoesterase family protein [Terriglobales bacterium]|nr:metallophosphoesterase family protein [Terriglobales bacterium]
MRVLVYSDVHANWEALEAVAAAAGEVDASICLGDIVGYGASPNETSAWVRQHTPTIIRGNHDRACASLDGIAEFNPGAATAARWTNAQLQPEHIEWLKSLPAGPLTWSDCNLVHGSPMDEDEYVVEAVQAAGAFASNAFELLWFGHTHVQGGFVLDHDQIHVLLTGPGALRQPADTPIPAQPIARVLKLLPNCRYMLNPGSVGQPRDGDWRAAFTIYDDQAREVTFRRVPYDLPAAQERILRAGLPPRLAHRLAQGR